MTGADDPSHRRIIDAGTVLHRIHRDRPGSIAFFDTSVHGRFNLTDIADRGTCYLTIDALGAYVETLGRILTRPQLDVDERRHSAVTIDRALHLFDLTRPTARSAYRSAGLDLTATIAAGDSYDRPPKLARLAHEDGYDGIHYTARHDPGHGLGCIALFGPAGPNDTITVFSTCKTDVIDDDLIESGRSTFGIEILPTPDL